MKIFQIILILLFPAMLIGCGAQPTQYIPFKNDNATKTQAPLTQLPTLPSASPTYVTVPDLHLENGRRSLEFGDYTTAQVEFQLAYDLTETPEIRAAALWGLGRVFMQIGNMGAALNHFNRLILDYAESPYRASAHFMRGEILMSLERYEEATEAYSSYLFLHPGVIDAYLYERRGDAYSAQGDYQNAIQDYQAALDSNRVFIDNDLEIKLAQSYADAGDPEMALDYYDLISIKAEDTHTKAQMDFLSGRLLLSIGRETEAYAKFLHCVENYPLEYDSYSALAVLVEAGIPVSDLDRGLIDFYVGQYGLAIDAFSRYATSFPENDGTVYYFRALALRDLGMYQEAVDALDFFIANYSIHFYWKAAWEEKADILWYYLGDYDAAAQTLLQLSNLTSDYSAIPQLLMDAGRIYERAGRLDRAATIWESIADDFSSSELAPRALFLSGITRYRAGSYNQALISFQRASLLSISTTDQIRSIFWVAKTQAILGDHTSSVASFQQAASKDQTEYYSLRAQDILYNRLPFEFYSPYQLTVDLDTERRVADSWLRVTFSLSPDTDLSGLSILASDSRLIRGTELWTLGLHNEAVIEFDDLMNSIKDNAPDNYRLGNYLLGLRAYRPAIFALRQVLTLAGMSEQLDTLAAPRYFNLVRYGCYFQELIVQYAEQTGFSPLFLFSVMRQESLFDPHVGSEQGALGLMQITPPTGQFIADNLGWPPGYSAEDLYRPVISIGFGSHYLNKLRYQFQGEIYTALAAYNAGPNAAMIWRDLSGPDPDLFLEIIRYPETSEYIRSIYTIYQMYLNLYAISP